MTSSAPPHSSSGRYRARRAFAFACLIGLAAVGAVWAQPGNPAPAKPGVEEGARWQDLKPTQRVALKPLEREWSSIDASRKQKWIAISAQYPKMSPDEQSRLQARMSEWAKLSPQERGTARLNFQEAKQLSAQDRQARWDAYKALPPEKRRALAEQAARNSEQQRKPGVAGPQSPTKPNDPAPPRARDGAVAKSNIVPNPSEVAPPKPVAPTVLRAGPGATTTLISKRPAPPSHQQTGLPKIAATPGFVDKSTLLPQRGPQAAATRSAAAASAGQAASRQ